MPLAAYLSTTAPRFARRIDSASGPIIEVAVLFAGIFVTMVPALAILNSWGKGSATCSARLRHDRAVAVLLGDGRLCRAFWTTRRRT